MKSSKKRVIKKNGELVLEISIDNEDNDFVKRLNKIMTTHKLLTASGKSMK